MTYLHLCSRSFGLVRLAEAVQSERPTLTDDVAERNTGRAVRLTARRSTPARSANHELA